MITRERYRAARLRLLVVLARCAGTLIRVGIHRMLPGLAGAGLFSLGVGVMVGRIWGHGLAPWTALAIAGVFLVRIGAEINAAPPLSAPRHDED